LVFVLAVCLSHLLQRWRFTTVEIDLILK